MTGGIVTGTLSLGSPWTRAEIPTYAERRAIADRIPAGYTIAITAKGDRSAFGVEVLELGDTMSGNRVIRERRYYRSGQLRDGIDDAIGWIADHATATYAGVEVAVR